MTLLSGAIHATEPTDTLEIDSNGIKYLEYLTVVEINKYRMSKGLLPVEWNDSASYECRKYSEFLRKENKFGHFAPLSHHDGENISNTGYNGADTYEENAKTIVQIWKDSPGHNALLLLEDAKGGAVGIVLEGGFGNGMINTYRSYWE